MVMMAFRAGNRRLYGRGFAESELQGAVESARAVVPIVMNLIHPGSVIDIGCGTGAWLRAFQECGVDNVLGLDGDYVDQSMLLIDSQYFAPVDLRSPLSINGRFDLALCLEVGEHLWRENNRSLVRALTAAAPMVLFSAAIPGQGGTGHVNEQWPLYWHKLLGDQRYQGLDLIRRAILFDRRVEWWYRQNITLFVSEEALAGNDLLKASVAAHPDVEFEWVHVRVLRNAQRLSFILRRTLQALQRGCNRIRNSANHL